MSQTRQEIQEQLDTKKAQLAVANAAYTAALTDSDIQTYTFDSGEGKQSTTRRDPGTILKQIRELEIQIRQLTARLRGTGVISTTLRRHGWR